MKGVSELHEALKSKSLTALTQAISEVADGLAYQLRPPHTEILQLKAQEGGGRFNIHFQARLYLHYSNPGDTPEGLVFTIKFGGDALSDSPSPPIHELFYAGVVESFHVCGYGSIWTGTKIATPLEFRKSLEVPSKTISEIDIDSFYRALSRQRVVCGSMH